MTLWRRAAMPLFCAMLGSTGCGKSNLTVQTYTSSTDLIAVNSFLISGDTEAVLVDGQLLKADATKVVEMVKASGKKLKMIFLTHAHPDHYAGLDVIKQAFPDASLVSTAEVVADFNKVAPGTFQGLKAMFMDALADKLATPTALTSDSFTIDGQDVKIIKQKLGESPEAAVLQVPSLNAVFAGDQLYGNVHLFVATCKNDEWVANIEALRQLGAKTYYPGHGSAGGSEILDADLKYLADVRPILNMGGGAANLIAAIKAKFPGLGAAGLLNFSIPQYQAACEPSLALPGAAYYPESLSASTDGALYVGSVATGQVVKFAAGSTTATTFLPAGGDIKGVSGVYVDNAGGFLYLCAIDPSLADPTKHNLRRFRLSDGAAMGTFSFPGANFCNDMTLDNNGHLYVADSFGKIFKLAKGGAALTLWSSDTQLAPTMMGGFGADGITFDGTSNLYVNTFSDGLLLRVPIKADGTADKPVAITVTPKLQSPDGMRQIDGSTLLVVEGVGRLTKVVVSGNSATATTVASGLDGPTSVIKANNKYYVTEGQLGVLFKQVMGPPNQPFRVRILPAP